MKKLILFFFVIVVCTFQFCTSSKKAHAMVKTTYVGNVQALVTANCSPCHIPPNNRKKAFDTYAAVKGDIDDIISRIEKNPDDRGFMPFKHAKLSDSVINVFVKWKADGLLEK